MVHLPLALPFIGLLALLLAVVVIMFQVGILTYVYQRLGLDQNTALTLLFASLLGSGINIPVAHVRSRRPIVEDQTVRFMGVRYPVPPPRNPDMTVIAVNVGGALIPAGLSLYLMAHDNLGLETLLAIAIVTLYVHFAARPIRGVGIAVSGLLPALVAAGVAILLGGPNVAAVAYVAGTLGTLLGADILNIGAIAELGTPVASIGGAGTFDGVFLSGILAVLIASF